MRIFLLVITQLLFIQLNIYAQVNQTDNDGHRQGKWQKNYPNGKLMYEGYFKDGKPAGQWTRYFEGGKVKAKISYDQLSDTASVELFDPVGRKIAEGTYVDEKREGKWLFYTSGRLISEEMYANGIRHGLSRTFYPAGETLEETDWQNGEKHGNQRVFFKNGIPYMQCKYSEGKRNGLCLSYYQNGKIEMEAWYENNLRHNAWKFYNEEGRLTHTLKYNQGNLLNPEVRDSIDLLNQYQFEKNVNPIADPENFMQNPTEYMMRMQNIR